jgi:hypothetical protein
LSGEATFTWSEIEQLLISSLCCSFYRLPLPQKNSGNEKDLFDQHRFQGTGIADKVNALYGNVVVLQEEARKCDFNPQRCS